MPGIKVLLRDGPQRAIALGTETHVLIFRHSPHRASASNTSLSDTGVPRCIVEFSPIGSVDLSEFRSLPSLDVKGTLGLVTIANDVFLCVVNDSRRAATVRPGETVQQIRNVGFHCLTRGDYDFLLNDQANSFSAEDLDVDRYEQQQNQYADRAAASGILEHPCMALKKLLSGGSFYYSTDFDLTKRLQDRPADASTVAIDSLDAGFLWNTHMIQPLVAFRSRLSDTEKSALDHSGILTSAIRGFAASVAVPAGASPARDSGSGLPSNITLISRLSCRRAGTRFNARGIDDDGNVANFVETETIFCTDRLCFSYVQVRGSVPLFWEQQSGLPGQQKIQVTRSNEATKPAFDKHFETVSKAYGDVFVVNLLSEEKPSETNLTRLYESQIHNSTLNERARQRGGDEHKHIKNINYDFHAETRERGYEAARGIKRLIVDNAIAFEYFLTEDTPETILRDGRKQSILGQSDVLTQSGVFRTNCLDCLDRTNLIQTIISQMVLEIFLRQQGERAPMTDFWARHGMLWADCGDALSKIYAGTGALKSSFTRSGKHSFAGMLADARKSAQRLYINNFEDKGRQNTIDMLLGRLKGQMPVQLYDPVNDWVTAETARRAAEFTSTEHINIWVGTFNLNGKPTGVAEDLSPWLCAGFEQQTGLPEIYGVAFQEIVDLDVQQIMSTDPHRRQAWEEAVRKTLNINAQKYGAEEYVLLRGGQLVGASLSVFVKASVLPHIKQVEGAVKKTGMSGMAGNKGAVAIRMEYADTSICLVTAHLAAGFANYNERNQDYQTISNGLQFQRDRSIEDHKTIIWFGDFNYRIGVDNERARALIAKRDFTHLYENDQLNIQMVHGKTFPHYSEQVPNFLPTYKYNLGTDDYDTSEKARIPAWCDRILTKGDNLRQLAYAAAPLRFSDHRPVWGLFRTRISVVDEATKTAITTSLSAQRRATIATRAAHTNTTPFDSDSDSLLDTDPPPHATLNPETGLPPASSDKRKWWLDASLPARTVAAPPNPPARPNPNRPSNPFPPTPEPDWVKISHPSTRNNIQNAPSSRPASIASTTSASSTASTHLSPAPQPATLSLEGASDPRPAHVPRKPAPPRPSKPSGLRGAGTSTGAGASASGSAAQNRATAPSVPAARRSQAPPPASGVGRSATSASAGPSGVARKAAHGSGTGYRDGYRDEEQPALPPRRAATTGLMDEDADEGFGGGLGGWTALVPK